ncbi:tRNA (adenosine(37)-N6)-dimethylallyltransferase MiaA [Sporolactobacillus sp. THM7-7]|nr:tRNA (adenosine(37)-N6)-dimethylallyltransferase MiaA [Sporolactobacillus sp. THM7-7]
MREKVVVIVGPTAVGKTKLSIILAKRFAGEIINGDAMQVYRGLNIGTAKITADEAEGVPHHLIDIRDPGEEYTAADFQKDARRVIDEVSQRGKLPILVGGTGFYVKAALFDYRFSSPGADPAFRTEMENLVKKRGTAALHERLKAIDPKSAARIHPHNIVRVIRALEVCRATGIPFSEQRHPISETPFFDTVSIGLTMDRSALYRRINQRVDQMIQDGLLDEAHALYRRGIRTAQSVQAIGYKELFPYFDGEVSLEEAVELLKRNTRRYAKRQLTWFRRQMAIHWFEMTDEPSGFSKTAEEIIQFIMRNLTT